MEDVFKEDSIKEEPQSQMSATEGNGQDGQTSHGDGGLEYQVSATEENAGNGQDGQTSSGDGGLEEDAVAAENSQDVWASHGDGGLEEDAVSADNGQDGQASRGDGGLEEDGKNGDDEQNEDSDIGMPLDLAAYTGSADGDGDRPGGEEGVPKSRVLAGSKRPRGDKDVLPEEVPKRKKAKLTIRLCPVRSCRAKPQVKLSNHLHKKHSYLSASQHQAALRQAKVVWRPSKRSKAERQQPKGGAPLGEEITSFFKRRAEESTFSCVVCVCVCMCVRVCHN